MESGPLQHVPASPGPIFKVADDLVSVRQRRESRKPLKLGSKPDKNGIELTGPIRRRQLERQRSDKVLGGTGVTVDGEGSERLEVRHDEKAVVVATGRYQKRDGRRHSGLRAIALEVLTEDYEFTVIA
jgi:hypothetical protein